MPSEQNSISLSKTVGKFRTRVQQDVGVESTHERFDGTVALLQPQLLHLRRKRKQKNAVKNVGKTGGGWQD